MNRAILKILLSDEEQLAVRMKAKWKDELNDFYIPPFILKQNSVQFPKLSHKQGNPTPTRLIARHAARRKREAGPTDRLEEKR
jgi:hypothetical protein